MKKSLSICALLAISATLVLADDNNGKVTFAAVEESLTVMSPNPRPGPGVASPDRVILPTDIVVPEGRSDLLINPSMVTAIFGRTENDGSRRRAEFAQSSESISIVVRVDGVVSSPGPVV